jgi:hypothetical protein
MPRLGSDGMLALVLLVAAVREDDSRPWSRGAARRCARSLRDVLDDEGRLGARLQRLLPAITLARAWERPPWEQEGMEAQHARGPRMPHDPSVAMLDRFGVCWMPPGALLERTRHDTRNRPGQLWQRVPGCGDVRGVWLGEAVQRLPCACALGLQHLRAVGCGPSSTPGRCFARLWPGRDHQTDEGTRADVLQTETHHERTGDPRLPSPGAPGASPGAPWRCGERRRLARCAAERARPLCPSCEGWSTGVSLPVRQKRCGDGGLNDARAARGDAPGREVLPLLALCRSRKPCLLGIHCFSVFLGSG